MVNVLLVDNDKSTIKEVKQYFSSLSSICILNSFINGEDALNELINYHEKYDVLLLNPILSKVDGYGILKYLKDNNINIKIILYSDCYNEMIIKPLSSFNISFYLLKSINNDILAQRILDSINISFQNIDIKSNDMVQKISKLLHDLGMPSHIKGYQYIRDAIYLMYNDSNYIGSITKILYPEIASRYNTTSSRVERAIRHAIEVSWSRGDYDLMDEIFGHSVDFDRAKPTNSEFLATIADKVVLDEKKIRLNV